MMRSLFAAHRRGKTSGTPVSPSKITPCRMAIRLRR